MLPYRGYHRTEAVFQARYQPDPAAQRLRGKAHAQPNRDSADSRKCTIRFGFTLRKMKISRLLIVKATLQPALFEVNYLT